MLLNTQLVKLVGLLCIFSKATETWVLQVLVSQYHFQYQPTDTTASSHAIASVVGWLLI